MNTGCRSLSGSAIILALLCAVVPALSAADSRSRGPLLAGELMGVAYSGFREGQHPDRGDGAVNPGESEILEDLRILLTQDFKLLRLYDSGENSATVLRLIRQQGLPFKVLLGMWLDAEISNHEGCPWLTEPIPDETLALNRRKNAAEIERGIELARDYSDVVVAVNVGNEALVDWNDHMVPLAQVIAYVKRVRGAVEQPVTVADNYEWWIRDGAPLAAELDFIGVHSYPAWENKSIDEALAYTNANIEAVRAALPGHPLAVLEAGWPSVATEFGERASAANQRRYYTELGQWARETDTPVVFFEAFDEPWKGDPGSPLGAEKHWGLFHVDRTPKQALLDPMVKSPHADSVVWAVNIGGAAYRGIDGVHYAADDRISGSERGTIGRVLGAQDPVVYQSYRSGNLGISRPLANGVYDLTFLFAEPEDIPAGERIFDVYVQGVRRIEGLDVRRSRDGNNGAALDRSVTGVRVTDGRLNVDFTATSGTPILNGLVVRGKHPDPPDWDLVWADEFDYEGAPDPSRWTVDVWDARKVNDEDQAYTSREQNVRVSDGKLILEAHREAYGDAAYTSGRVHSRGKGDLLYGRVEIRARLPGAQGTWSALWMLPSDPYRYATTCTPGEDWQGSESCDAWPNSGEIDIMEHVGYDMHRVHGTVHNRAYYWANSEQRKGSVEVRDVHTAFHDYALEWTPDSIHVFIDGSLYFSYFNQGEGWRAWPFDHPYHIIMNLAIGGLWGRAGGPIDDSLFPLRMEVDHVRVFKAANLTAPR